MCLDKCSKRQFERLKRCHEIFFSHEFVVWVRNEQVPEVKFKSSQNTQRDIESWKDHFVYYIWTRYFGDENE